MKSSFYYLIPFLLFILNHLLLSSPEPDPILENSLKRPSLSLYNPSTWTTQKTQPLYCWGCLFTDPLPNNGRPVVVRVRSRGSVFTESLPSNRSVRPDIIYRAIIFRPHESNHGNLYERVICIHICRKWIYSVAAVCMQPNWFICLHRAVSFHFRSTDLVIFSPIHLHCHLFGLTFTFHPSICPAIHIYYFARPCACVIIYFSILRNINASSCSVATPECSSVRNAILDFTKWTCRKIIHSYLRATYVNCFRKKINLG
jgi:hypothetical protein